MDYSRCFKLLRPFHRARGTISSRKPHKAPYTPLPRHYIVAPRALLASEKGFKAYLTMPVAVCVSAACACSEVKVAHPKSLWAALPRWWSSQQPGKSLLSSWLYHGGSQGRAGNAQVTSDKRGNGPFLRNRILSADRSRVRLQTPETLESPISSRLPCHNECHCECLRGSKEGQRMASKTL